MTGAKRLLLAVVLSILSLLSFFGTTRNAISSIQESIASSWPTGLSPTQRTMTTIRISTGFPEGRLDASFHLNASSEYQRIPYIPKYPRWDGAGINIDHIIDFILNSSQFAVAPRERKNTSYIPTNDHATDVGYWFPETLYIFDSDGLWCSQRHRNITDLGKGTVKDKLAPTERVAMRAWKTLTKAPHRWPRLSQSLKEGFPFLMWYGDYTGCNENNWRDTVSIPLFTTAASIDCQYAIPFPNYQTIVDSQISATAWDQTFQQAHERYPWLSKRPKVVWRGSLTGNVLNSTHKSTRWIILEEIHKLAKSTDGSMFDFQATRLPKRHEGQGLNLSSIGGIGDGFRSMEEFQSYQAIFDMDGNSWSSRFGKLLCFNSIVLKMKPRHVDYFFFDTLPWVHYIPVVDASDLVEKARFALDPSNEQKVRNIILEANAWCRRRMGLERIEKDMLNIWEAYVHLLDAGSGGPQWQTSTWAHAKTMIRQADSPLSMIPLPT